MRVAQFCDCYTPRINGVTTSLQMLKAGLEEAGHEVRLVVPDYPNQCQPESGVHRLRSLYMPLQPEDRMGLPWPALGWKPDVVHVHTPFSIGLQGWWLARRHRLPLVFTHHTLWEEYAHYLKGVPLWLGRGIGKSLCDFYFRQAQAVVLPSQQVARTLVGTRVLGLHRVIPTGIDFEEFAHGDSSAVVEEMPQEPCFLYMGRIGKEKSLDFLLRCFCQYRQEGGPFHLVLIGGGPELEPLKSLARNLGVGPEVHFLGYRQRHQLKHYLAAARAFLFASQTETQGLVLLEASAAGLPVVAVRASGVNEAVEHETNGLLVDPGQPQAFVEAMWRLQREPELYSRLSRQAQEWAQGFSTQEMARKMTSLYEAIGGRRSP